MSPFCWRRWHTNTLSSREEGERNHRDKSLKSFRENVFFLLNFFLLHFFPSFHSPSSLLSFLILFMRGEKRAEIEVRNEGGCLSCLVREGRNGIGLIAFFLLYQPGKRRLCLLFLLLGVPVSAILMSCRANVVGAE